MYTWLVTVQHCIDDGIIYSQLGKVPYTKVELQYMGFMLYSLDDYYSFIAQHSRHSMQTLAALRLNYTIWQQR